MFPSGSCDSQRVPSRWQAIPSRESILWGQERIAGLWGGLASQNESKFVRADERIARFVQAERFCPVRGRRLACFDGPAGHRAISVATIGFWFGLHERLLRALWRENHCERGTRFDHVDFPLERRRGRGAIELGFDLHLSCTQDHSEALVLSGSRCRDRNASGVFVAGGPHIHAASLGAGDAEASRRCRRQWGNNGRLRDERRECVLHGPVV
jgi:hypothetical protein